MGAHPDSTAVTTDTTDADTADIAGLVSVSDPATEGRTLLVDVAGNTVKLVLGADLLVGSSVTLTYANAVAPTNFDVTYDFTLKSGTASAADTIPPKLDADGDLIGAEDATEGKFSIKIASAVAGTGTAVIAGAGDATTGTAGAFATTSAASTNTDLTFTFTASGQMDGQQIRLVTPSGWSNPSGTPGTTGYISSSDTGSKLGYPTFDGKTVSYGIVNVGGSATAAENDITITYTDGVAQNSAVAAPETDKTDTRPKFSVQTRVASTDGWTEVKSIPITVTNAANGTGTAVISPAEIGASSVADYTVTYTAAGTLDGGKVSLDIPTGWTTAVGLKDADGNDIANDLINTATVLVSTTGTLTDADEDGDVIEHLVYAGRTVTATLATLSATQTVSFLIKNVQAPTSVSIDIADVTGTTAGRLTADAIDGTNFVVSSSATVAAPTAIRDVDSNAVSPSVIVRTAKPGTGTAALTTAVTILQGGGDPGPITIRFTPVADMLPGSTVAVTVPTGWTAPVAADADNNPAGELLFVTTVSTDGDGTVANQVTNVTTAISANTVTATLGEDDVIDEKKKKQTNKSTKKRKGRKIND